MDEPTESLDHRLLELTGIVPADETLEASLEHVAEVSVRAIGARGCGQRPDGRDFVEWPSTKAS